jgi:hypothetical protein
MAITPYSKSYRPQVAQELLLQETQALLPPATARPLLLAKKTESNREVCSLSHFKQAMGASASFIGRMVSKCSPQSKQEYS